LSTTNASSGVVEASPLTSAGIDKLCQPAKSLRFSSDSTRKERVRQRFIGFTHIENNASISMDRPVQGRFNASTLFATCNFVPSRMLEEKSIVNH
jgi:hypothetical protein